MSYVVVLWKLEGMSGLSVSGNELSLSTRIPLPHRKTTLEINSYAQMHLLQKIIQAYQKQWSFSCNRLDIVHT
jgi:hypothetical protein